MSADDIESYQYQLDQVQFALSKDPDNEELKSIEQSLQELITLSSQLEPKKTTRSPRSATPSTPSTNTSSSPVTALRTHQFSVGQEVMAKWAGDGQYYRATITAIGGADQVFSVVFRGYQENEIVKAEDIRAIETKKKRQGIFEDVVVKKKKKDSKPTNNTASAGSEKKKKVNEVEVKKNAWLNFATASEKKKKKVLPINKKSIFKTPDNPEGKVGVVGSGRGMTNFQQRGKHVYAGDDDEE
ncbi:hypothetical protein EC973_005681 [Apophysomyces ossiformis]|uniref:Tudor domain-containing protein n=1 Tax=Apophysomyces ossiformis TaxID=679940 RepID=A0A8H7BW64_9FUNG|nr:hypothetical protein EC973_005681 [Apophysomyces ossiformis]